MTTNYNKNNSNCNNHLVISVHFTISEALYRLTLGYHGIASPVYANMDNQIAYSRMTKQDPTV
jgi:hypothetical protein